jgi:adenosylcobinamide-GDP ribazoletransferase
VSIRSLRSAVAFLTVIPAADRSGSPGARLGRAYFPAVGAAVGLLGGAAFILMSAMAGPLLGGVAAVAVLAILTGGLHLDGLADAADGLFGAGTLERRLEVMRDPRIGSFGAVALVIVLAGDVAALASMSPARALIALVIAGALSRLAVLAVIVLAPYRRQDGLGVAAQGSHGGFDLALGTALTTILCLLDPRRAAVAAVVVALVAVSMLTLARRRIGGATGDVYGAVAELSQLAALIVFAAALGS